MKSNVEHAIEVGKRLQLEERRRSRMAYVLLPRFERLAKGLTLDELNEVRRALGYPDA